MKRLFFQASAVCLVTLAVPASMLALFACDPSLTPQEVPGEGGPVTPTPTDAAAAPERDAATPADASDAETSTSEEAGTTAHTIDGTNDFTSGQKLPTTSPLYDGYVSWDETNVYFGMDGSDVAANTATKWVLIYIDGNPGNAGSTAGIAYNCSGSCTNLAPTLPFAAGYHIRWKADGTYTNLQKWDGSAWTDKGTISAVARSGPFMELAVSRVALGSPTGSLKVHMNMLIEQSGAEWSYSGVPSTSFTDGKNPTFTKYFAFDLTNATKAPNTYAPLP